jgi:hypothetical protein
MMAAPVFLVCAWCDILMGIVPPLEDGRASHGLCSRCADRVRFEDGPPVRAVIVVHRARPRLYESLRLAFEGVPRVQVILDQRLGERRSRQGALDPARPTPRRRPWSKRERETWRTLNVVVVHCR